MSRESNSSYSSASPAIQALLSFTAQNVRSYWDEVHLSLLGTRLSAAEVVREVPVAGTRTPVRVLPAAGIFGANASGKSTVLRAIADMRATVLGSFRQGDAGTGIHRYPFLLRAPVTRPSRFAIDLILAGVRWQYGFEIDDRRVLAEYAYHYPQGRQALVFRRERDSSALSFGPSFRVSGRTLARLTRANALLLSVAGAAEDDHLGPLFAWFRRSLRLAEFANRGPRTARTADLVRSPDAQSKVLAMLQAADLGIMDIERFQLDPEVAERIQRAARILSGFEDDPGAGADNQFVLDDLIRLNHQGPDGPIAIDPAHESQGTLVWVSLIGPVLDALRSGETILVDELDASLHPHLVQRLIRLFQDHATNPRCAQLIFNAHDVTILGDSGQRTLGRDQIWLTEKNTDGATTLDSLAEFRPKGDEALARRYLQGRYGGVPVLDPAQFLQAVDSTDS